MSNTARSGSAVSALRQVPKNEWRGFFDLMSKALLGKRAEVEVASLDLGDQIVAEWVPLIGITYDSRDDLLDVGFDPERNLGNRLIRRPQQIDVEEGPTGLAMVAVVDADGVRHIIRLKDPVMLPRASAAE
jgi:hypothetical protein